MDRFETEVRTADREMRHPAMVAGWIAVLLLIVGGFIFAQPAFWICALGWLFALVAFFYFWRPLRVLAIDEHGVQLNGKQMLTRSEIVSAVAYEDAGGRCHVVIASDPRAWSGGLLHLDVPDMTAARAIVRALDLPRSDFFRTKILDHKTFRWAGALTTTAGVAIMFAHHSLLLLASLWAFVALILTVANRRMFVGTEYLVGSDGLRVRLFRQRFISFAELEKIDRGVGVDQFRVRLHIGKKKPLVIDGVQPHRIAQLQMKLSEALERYRLHAIAGQTPPDLERRDRSTRDWIASLRSLGSSSTTKYRVAATSPDDLARVLTDQSADVAARAAAAVALDAIDREAVARIRDVASHTANPKLRVALERVADHAADAKIEASLEELVKATAR